MSRLKHFTPTLSYEYNHFQKSLTTFLDASTSEGIASVAKLSYALHTGFVVMALGFFFKQGTDIFLHASKRLPYHALHTDYVVKILTLVDIINRILTAPIRRGATKYCIDYLHDRRFICL